MTKEDIKDLKEVIKNAFVLVVFESGHEHTIKAYGILNEWVESNKTGLGNQIVLLVLTRTFGMGVHQRLRLMVSKPTNKLTT